MNSQQADSLRDFIASMDLRKTMKQADKLGDDMKENKLAETAPELLRVCKILRDAIADVSMPEDDMLDMLHDVIEKAEGKGE